MVNDLIVSLGVNVEEGEISDSVSVEEISAEDFSAKSSAIATEIAVIKNTAIGDSKQQQRQSQKVWTMEDLMKYQKKYQMSRNYAPGLYNFAWAQAVQNKPLDDYLTTMNTSITIDNNLKQAVLNGNSDDDIGVNNDKIVMDISGEEGELEEGEIDLDSEVINGGNVDKWIDVIRIGLEGITVNEAKKSFVGVCSRLEGLLDNLSTLLLENSVSIKEELVNLAFSAIQIVNSVFCSMSHNQKEQSMHLIIRVLTNVKSYMSAIFSPEQLKEVEIMFLSCNSNSVYSSTNDKDEDMPVTHNSNQTVVSLIDESILDATSDENPKQSGPLKNRVLLPLLEIHKDHDVDSLPSPTRETTHNLPPGNSLFVGDQATKPEWPTPRAVLHRYETDALKAVTTYQQKFGPNSFFSSDFPSPTPSEESGDAGGDCGGEVSSFSTVRNPISVTRVPNKKRDPRLRLANSRSSLEFNRVVEPLVVDGPAPKRLKTESVNSVTTSGLPTSASLQSILKDIAVNPAQWMDLMNMEQQKSVDPAKYVVQSSTQNSYVGSMPMATVATRPLAIEQRSTVEMQIPQTASSVSMLSCFDHFALSVTWADDSVKVRMKPRDPRRALHNKLLKKTEPVNNLLNIKGNKGNSKQPDLRVSSSQPTPDITRKFTKNLKNIADIVSTTVSTSSSQPAQVHSSFVNIKGPTSEEVSSSGPAQSHNAWDNVEQYFGRFDDQQRAAIQRERSKRMEEQKKMFADRKLCLVLDLDHTLLNSAKFSEVEPVHDEMLKKKEEQERDKPHKHLFRFPYMCMWTKLRPGVWKFLEKASKLFELHLYTMGNKLYATEMAKILDPKGVLFNGRVISRGDDGDSVDGDPKSKDLEGVLGMESAVVIIDDSIRVWPHNKPNLIVVERYIYFPCSRRQFGLPGPSLLEIDHDERPEDGTLASSLAVIEKIHENFFLEKSLEDADVRNILASEQRKILGGCRIVFSRVFPVGQATPHLHPLWQTAEQFGAICTNQIDEQVTHVVANSLGTDKVNWALATGRPVVHPGWVEASALLYRRANEHDFAVKP